MAVNIVYCSMTPVESGGPDGTQHLASVSVSGIIVAPDGSLLQIGAGGGYSFGDMLPLSHGASLESLKDAVISKLQDGYGMTDLEAHVAVFPLL